MNIKTYLFNNAVIKIWIKYYYFLNKLGINSD